MPEVRGAECPGGGGTERDAAGRGCSASMQVLAAQDWMTGGLLDECGDSVRDVGLLD